VQIWFVYAPAYHTRLSSSSALHVSLFLLLYNLAYKKVKRGNGEQLNIPSQ